MEINKYLRICLKNGIKCYPIKDSKSGLFRIEVNNKGKITTFKKTLKNSKEVNTAVTSTYGFYAKKILEANGTKIDTRNREKK